MNPSAVSNTTVSRRSYLTELADDLIEVVQTFLTNDDYHYLMNTSKEYFDEIKKRTIYFSLHFETSLQYIRNTEGFQDLVLSKVVNGWKQIGVTLVGFSHEITLSVPIHKYVNLSDHPGIFSNVKHIKNLLGLKVTLPLSEEIGGSSNDLDHLEALEISLRGAVTDISLLQNIKNLTVEYCWNVKSFNMFNADRQKTLKLIGCRKLTNVTNFRRIHCLSLHDCRNLKDISSLHGIHNLSVSACPQVKDISGLGDHKCLTISFCHYNLNGYDSLLHIPCVTLDRCDISNLSVLRYAKKVTLKGCGELVDVSPIANARMVTVGSCLLTVDLSPLRHVPELSYTFLSPPNPSLGSIMTQAQLKNHTLMLTSNNYDSLHDYSFLKNVRHLTFSGYFLNKHLEELAPHVTNLRSISFIGCPIFHLNGLGEIPILRVDRCQGVADVSALGRNHSVFLRECSELRVVDSLATVPVVTIIACRSIKSFESLKNVPRLKLD